MCFCGCGDSGFAWGMWKRALIYFSILSFIFVHLTWVTFSVVQVVAAQEAVVAVVRVAAAAAMEAVSSFKRREMF